MATLEDLLQIPPDQITPQHVHMLGLAPDPVVPPAAPAAPPITKMTPPASVTESPVKPMTPPASPLTVHYYEGPNAHGSKKEPKAEKPVEIPQPSEADRTTTVTANAPDTEATHPSTVGSELPNTLTPPAPDAVAPMRPPVVQQPTTASTVPNALTPPAAPAGIDTSLLNAPKRSLEGFKSREAEPRNLSLDTTAGGPQILDKPGSSGYQADIIARNRDEAAHPYGSAENHPGFLGKLAHVAARIGNIAGDIVAPGTMALIPGTDLNKRATENVAQNRLAAAQTRETAAANEKSEEGLRQAETEKIQAETEKLGKAGIRPEKDANGDITGWWDKDGNPHGLNDPDTPQGLKDIATATRAKVKTPDETYLAAQGRILQGIGTPEDQATVKAYSDMKQAAQDVKPGDAPLGDKTQQLNSILTRRYQVLHRGQALPADYTLPANATQKDYDRIDKGLEAEEKARGTKEQQDESNAFKQMALSIAQQNRADKTDLSTKEKVLTYFQPAQDADVRLQLMESNMKDALDHNDQQAMVNLLNNHVAMTMGMPRGKVPRISHEMFNEAAQSAPLLQRADAHFDKDGYLTGIVLSPQQMEQMVNLGKETRRAEWAEANAKADYIGVEKRPTSSYKEGGAGQKSPAGGGASKTYSQADVDAAVAAHPGMTAAQIEDAFKKKNYTKQDRGSL